ncbi:hypothetical protein MLD38_010443 [Melastoma candidum]|uniref:Uncharacterized protein n=1 Tax=Melastoma candidum TaxID=119954 RepID=A0ACB9QZV5_9MYRT|nr:hypothetical protein MLD38_010443 [Melastoma candidum]
MTTKLLPARYINLSEVSKLLTFSDHQDLSTITFPPSMASQVVPFLAVSPQCPEQAMSIHVHPSTNKKAPADEDPKKGKKKPENSNKSEAKYRRKMQGLPRAPRVGFWYVATSIRYILRKAKAFYNECCCAAFADEAVNNEVASVEPYFSIPVIHPPPVSS